MINKQEFMYLVIRSLKDFFSDNLCNYVRLAGARDRKIVGKTIAIMLLISIQIKAISHTVFPEHRVLRNDKLHRGLSSRSCQLYFITHRFK